MDQEIAKQKAFGDNFTRFDGGNAQAFVEAGGEAEGVGPSVEKTELRLDDRAGAIFDGAADDGKIVPILRGKRKTS
ncbi:MAG TPA: hypothetical protein VJR23_16975 [Candidatus Acidoferrales bacterium]|nr:hypothetical protein [Candidatus Acidoferrales bacterium]